MIQMYKFFDRIYDLIINLRYCNPHRLPARNCFGILDQFDHSIQNAINNNNWNYGEHLLNQMTIQFYLNSKNQSFLVEEWTFVTNSSYIQEFKKLIIFLRTIVQMSTLTSLFQFSLVKKYDHIQLSHRLSLHAKNQQSPRTSSWFDASSIATRFHQVNFQDGTEINYCLSYATSLNSHQFIQKLTKQRSRFFSDGQITEFPNNNNNNNKNKSRKSSKDLETESNNSRKSVMSLVSRKDEVEFLSTPENARRLMDQNPDEFQMIIFEDPSENQQQAEQKPSSREQSTLFSRILKFKLFGEQGSEKEKVLARLREGMERIEQERGSAQVEQIVEWVLE